MKKQFFTKAFSSVLAFALSIMVCGISVYANNESDQGYAVAKNVDEWSYLTLDALNSRYNSYQEVPKGKVNGIKLGEKQGIHLNDNTKYKLTFEYRLDEIIRPNNDIGCSYNCRTPLFYVYKNGRDPVTVNFDRYKSDGTFMDTKGFQDPWQLTIGKWYSYTLEFETTTNAAGDSAVWFAPISYGGMKSSYRNIAISTENGTTTYYSIEKMRSVNAVANVGSNTYNDENKNPSATAPEILISRNTSKATLTLDALGARYNSYDTTNTGRVNGIKLGEKQGIHLNDNTKYKLTFEYRLDGIIRPDSTNSVGCSYGCRTPLFFIYKNGKDPSTVAFNRYKNDGTFMDTTGAQDPWQLTIGKWYSYTLEFETTTNAAGDSAVWFAPISYGGMKSSYRNIVVTSDDNTEIINCYMGETIIPETADISTTTYNDENQSTTNRYPEILVSKIPSYITDFNEDGIINICDLVECSLNENTLDYMESMRKILLGIEV